MGLSSVIPLLLASTSFVSYHLMKRNVPQALEAYHKEVSEIKEHDFSKLEEIAFAIIEQGFRSGEAEDNVLALFGASVAQNERFLPMIEELFNKGSPEVQFAAINVLASFQNERADSVIQKALGSPYLELRMEALYALANKKDPRTLSQTEALLAKLPQKGAILFPEIFALLGTEKATIALKKLFLHPDHAVRLMCILSAIEFKRDDLLPSLRSLSHQQDTNAQEATAFAFGLFKDEASKERLWTLSQSSSGNVSLSALYALYQLGERKTAEPIEERAKEGNLFAITLLGAIEEGTDTLLTLKSSRDLQIRGNALLALLEKRHEACLPDLLELMLEGAKDFACEEIHSQGKTLKAYHITPSAREHAKDDPVKRELTLSFREKLLRKTLNLKPEAFLKLARTLLLVGDSPLTPTLISLLESLQTDDAIAILKASEGKAGAPLTRTWCTLALCRLGEGAAHKEALQQWMNSNKEVPLIRFRPPVPKEKREFIAVHHLSPEETSSLLIGSFEWLAKTREIEAIDTLLSLIEKGNEKNKYALAGLLIRALQ